MSYDVAPERNLSRIRAALELLRELELEAEALENLRERDGNVLHASNDGAGLRRDPIPKSA